MPTRALGVLGNIGRNEIEQFTQAHDARVRR
jgi:hypothetical protein